MTKAPSIKEALEPFAALVPSAFDHSYPDDAEIVLVCNGEPHAYLKNIDFRRAKAAFAALTTLQPSGERREAIARIMVRNDPNYEIYHMPGDAPRKWQAQSGYVGPTSELSEDRAESVRKLADLILASGLVLPDPTTSKKEVVGNERREAIARALAEKWPGDYMQGDDECEREPNALAYETADLILASGLVPDEAVIRADELEKLFSVVTDKLKDETSERYAKGWNNALISVCAAIRSARNGGGS